ncbi:MAG TPA: GDP-mannose 4,6-dehydratase [Thermoanaerobaculia bacterium]|nr:GDP-mannose 4,6-dehydratase [Thermoanaerobaculia bacterium]
MKRALITGIAGQDGHYLSELLLAKGYEVVGLAHGPFDDPRIEVVQGDVGDERTLDALFRREYDELYNLAGESYGPRSWDDPAAIGETLGIAVTRLLERIRGTKTRFLQASSSELFGHATEVPQSERTPLAPITPYGAAKLYAQTMVAAYRARHAVYSCAAILFNHESPRRRPEFVTRKIARHAAAARLGMAAELRLGNLDAQRDWGFAGDFVEAMWLMLQQPEADDFVVATGRAHTVRDFCAVAFEHVGLDYRDHVTEDPALVRRDDFQRIGDPSKARHILGWEPRVSFEQLVQMMVDADLEALR